MKKKDEARPRGIEPQSYGGGADWVSGHTGQTVDETPHKTKRHDEEFYKSKRDDKATTAEGPARRSAVDDSVENDPSPDPPASGEDIPRKPV